MNKDPFPKALLAVVLCLSIALAGCNINFGGWPCAKYERTVQLSAPMPAGSTFIGETHNGSITVDGTEPGKCNLLATITGRARTEDEAKELAEATEVRLERPGNEMIARIEKPKLKNNQSISVSLDVEVPDHSNLELKTHNGAISVTNITGTVNGASHNGGVTARRISGNIELRTYNGKVNCKQISGDARLKTYNGGVEADYCETASPICSISIVTHNGGIRLAAPTEFSGTVDVSTHNGSIKTDLPVTVIGEVNKRKLTGKIGTGQGKLHLQTYNGSIRIR